MIPIDIQSGGELLFHRPIPVTVRLLMPCSKLRFRSRPFSAGRGNPAFRLSALAFFFASRENATLTDGILNRRIQPFDLSGRRRIGGSGGRRSRGDGDGSAALYFITEHVSQPQNGAWSFGGKSGERVGECEVLGRGEMPELPVVVVVEGTLKCVTL